MVKIFCKFSFLFAIFLVFNCCKKDSQQRYDWTIYNNNRVIVCVVTDKTEQELLSCLQTGSCCVLSNRNSITSCNYVRNESDVYCWVINGKFYKDLSNSYAEFYANCVFGGVAKLKVDCNTYCENLYTRKCLILNRRDTSYSAATQKNICNTSLLDSIYRYNYIFRKNKFDTTIIDQYGKDSVNWFK